MLNPGLSCGENTDINTHAYAFHHQCWRFSRHHNPPEYTNKYSSYISAHISSPSPNHTMPSSSPRLPQTLNPPTVSPPKPSYSHVCITPLHGSARLITVAGQVGISPTDGSGPASFSEQVSIALANLSECLKAAGATPRDIVKTTHYTLRYGPEDHEVRGRLYGEFMGGDWRPPSTLVPVVALAEKALLYEIEVMAVVHSEG